MKKIKIAFVVIFASLIILPVARFNTEDGAASAIDNRKLAENPVVLWREARKNKKSFNFAGALGSYASDRIGFRNDIIRAYIQFYDVIFGEMKHPGYMYGQDGYVFTKRGENRKYTQFESDFADMTARAAKYCEERGVPFYFMFSPNKESVLTQYLPKGHNYRRDWVDKMLRKMTEQGVRVVDNTPLLRARANEGLVVYNKEYDANHWNDLGAFHGVNNLIKAMREDGLNAEENKTDDYEISVKTETTLPVSEFPINEETPAFAPKNDKLYRRKDELFDALYWEVKRDRRYTFFADYVNREKKNSPRLLIFHGSYLNGRGTKFLAAAFGEYIGVHDYQNAINLPYYFNVFKPDVVVIEAAEYALTPGHFDEKAMKEAAFYPALEPEAAETNAVADVVLMEGKALSDVIWHKTSFEKCAKETGVSEPEAVYAVINGEAYDMRKSRGEAAYECAALNGRVGEAPRVEIIARSNGENIKFKAKREDFSNVLRYVGTSDNAALSADVVTLSNGAKDNTFSYLAFQIQTQDGVKEIARTDKNAAGVGEIKFDKYVCELETGEYTVRLKANGSKKDEYIEYKAELKKGGEYCVGYRVRGFNVNNADKVTAENVFFMKK